MGSAETVVDIHRRDATAARTMLEIKSHLKVCFVVRFITKGKQTAPTDSNPGCVSV